VPVRVIRVLEYEYPDHAAAEDDMSRWGVPANGVCVMGRAAVTIRSATTFPTFTTETIKEERDD
jgi:hypothetical protein